MDKHTKEFLKGVSTIIALMLLFMLMLCTAIPWVAEVLTVNARLAQNVVGSDDWSYDGGYKDGVEDMAAICEYVTERPTRYEMINE